MHIYETIQMYSSEITKQEKGDIHFFLWGFLKQLDYGQVPFKGTQLHFEELKFKVVIPFA